MNKGPGIIRELREALAASPNNVPLRRLLADTLLGHGLGGEAEKEYRSALALSPKDHACMLGLAQACFQQGKPSESMVIIEELMRLSDPPPSAYLLHARLLMAAGDKRKAREQYRWAVEADPAVADDALSEQLGFKADDQARNVEEARERVPVAPAAGSPVERIERPTITFEDVGGMDSVKEEIRLKIIHPMTHRELFESYGKAAGGGILLYGPPGCGKTHLARATAGEVKAAFFAVGIHEILDIWVGGSEKNLHGVFASARSNAPSVLFFDEVDALGSSRSEFRHQAANRHVINQFLEEMDGVKSSNEGVLVLAATNAPWYVDSAFRRPGRFDRVIFVPPPDSPARLAILRILLAGRPAKNVDCERVASRTEGFSGADLKAVVDLAVEGKLIKAMKSGKADPLTTADLLQAADRRKPTTLEWFATARNYVTYANQGGEYDDLARHLDM